MRPPLPAAIVPRPSTGVLFPPRRDSRLRYIDDVISISGVGPAHTAVVCRSVVRIQCGCGRPRGILRAARPLRRGHRGRRHGEYRKHRFGVWLWVVGCRRRIISVRTVSRLREDLDLDTNASSVAMTLVERIHGLEAQLHALCSQFPALQVKRSKKEDANFAKLQAGTSPIWRWPRQPGGTARTAVPDLSW